MASERRSAWPFVLLLGLCVSVLLGGAVAVAVPSEGSRPWWRDTGPQHLTGTVVSLDRAEGSVVLGELFTYEPDRTGSIGSIGVTVDDLGNAQPGATVDLDVVRHDGRWTASGLTVLDTD
jgi:hypothetical protein